MTSRPAGPVVFDLEFTAWPGSIQSQWSRPGEFREVVQIGAVRLSPRTLKPVEEFEMLIIPRLNPVLSDFFVQLTGITNEALTRRGVDFITAFRAFLDFSGASHLWAHGRDDLVLASRGLDEPAERPAQIPADPQQRMRERRHIERDSHGRW